MPFPTGGKKIQHLLPVSSRLLLVAGRLFRGAGIEHISKDKSLDSSLTSFLPSCGSSLTRKARRKVGKDGRPAMI